MSQDTPRLEQQAAQSRENQLRFIYGVLLRRWFMIFTITAASALVYGFAGILKQETGRPHFQAQAKVIVRPSFWDSGILKDVGGAPLTPMDAESLVKRTSRQSLSENVARTLVQQDIADGRPLSRIVTEEEYAAKAAEVLNALEVVPEDPQSGVILIRVTRWPDQEEAYRLAEFAARVFVEEHRQAQLEEEQNTHDAVKKRLEDLQQELYAAETAEWEFKKQMGFQTYGQVGEDMAAIYEELSEKKAIKDETQSRLVEIEAQLEQNSAELPLALGNVTDSVVEEMMTELDDLLQEQLSMSVIYNPGFPGLEEIEDEIAEKKDAILEAVRRLDTSVGGGGGDMWQQRQVLYRQQVDLRLEVTGLDIRIAALQHMLEELIPKIPELANKNLEYERLAQETEHIRTQFNRLREKEFDIRTALSRESGQVARHESVIASPLPLGGANVRTWMNFVVGGLVGFMVGFGLAIMLEIMDTSIRSIEDVTTYIGIEVIGTIPLMQFGKPGKGGRRRGTYVVPADEEQVDACIVTQYDPKSPVSEAYRTLRTNFQFATLKQRPRTVMVTSAVPGEGKTTTAVNLAVTMADRGIRVLVVDTDLRRPNVHRVLKMERGPGLADILREQLDFRAVMRETGVDNLWSISSGRVPPNPSELIGSDRMQRLMQELGKEFDLVVCDAPSILVVTDPILLATCADTVALVVSVNNARRETVQRAVKLLQTANAHIAGVVLNGLAATRRHYYYYYYYYDDGSSRARRRWYHLFQ